MSRKKATEQSAEITTEILSKKEQQQADVIETVVIAPTAIQGVAVVTDRKKFKTINVRNENDEIIGEIANGSIIKLIDYDPAIEKQTITGYDFNTSAEICGTIPTTCIRPL